LGHRRIAIITGPLTTRSSADRVEGHRRAMRALHVPLRRDFIRVVDFETASGARAAMDLLTGMGRPTAVFCTNNTLTLGALEAIQQLGMRCPKEVSLLGFDDSNWSTLVRPRLTMVRQPAREIGMTAVQVLIDYIEQRGPRVSADQLLPTQLMIRDSCAPPARKTDSKHLRRRALSAT
jgi:DNA-binding LacI/PurR family transcriptional regulator